MTSRVAATAAACMLGLGFAGTASAAPEGTLINAAENKHHDEALKLLAGGADAKAKDVDNTTALHWAAHYADVDLADKLIHAGADVNAKNDYDSTPMMEAATIGNADIIKLLLKAGADVESTNREGQTALVAAARTGNVAAAEALVKKGANVNAVEQWGGQSALMWAAAQSQPAMVAFLVKHGAEVNARGAVREWQRRMTAEGRPKNMNHGGFTPLLYAAREGCIECGKILLKAKADINLQDPDGLTPLVLALTNMRFDFAAMLIEAGADVNKWDFWGRTPGGDLVISTGATPLLVAAKVGDFESVALLIKYKSEIDLPNSGGVTPYMAAAGVGQSADPTRGRYKTDAEAVECLKLLKAAGASPNAVADNGLTSLHSAASLGWNGTIRQLVADGAQLEALDRNGLTPIDYAVGRQPRGFLEPEHTRKDESYNILKDFIVASTGRAPKEYTGKPLTQETGGTGARADRETAEEALSGSGRRSRRAADKPAAGRGPLARSPQSLGD